MPNLRRVLNRTGWWRWGYRPGYEFAYACLKSVVSLICAPLWRPRRVGATPHIGPDGMIFCPNHDSYLDPAFVQIALPRRVTFMMTNAFYRHILGRWFFKSVGAIPVTSGRMGREGLRRAMALVRLGEGVVIFPEGGLSRDGRRGRGQRGVAVMAHRTGAPVVPVAIVGSRDAWPPDSKRPGFARVRVAFGSPMYWPRGTEPTKQAQRAFVATLMANIERTIQDLHDRLERRPH